MACGDSSRTGRLMASAHARVLHVSHTSMMSGAEHSLLALMRSLEAGRSLGLACPHGDLADAARTLGIPVHLVPGTDVSLRLHALHTPRATVELVAAGAAIARVSRRLGADVLHANSLRAGLIAGLAGLPGAPPTMVHVRDVLPSGLASRAVRRATLRTAAAVVANSRFTAERFVEGMALMGDVPVDVVDNPIDMERFDVRRADTTALRAELGLAHDAPVLALVGQITRWKGHETAIRALTAVRERHPDARLVIAGAVKFTAGATRLDNPSYLREMRELAQALGVDSAVHWLGERSDVAEVMATATVALVPSSEEPFGRTVVEALAVGTPVIATSAGGPREILEDGRLGVLLDPSRDREWAEAILAILADPAAARRIAAHGSSVVRERYNLERHARHMGELFDGLLEARSAA
jgi:L-malate glycosyltransferase